MYNNIYNAQSALSRANNHVEYAYETINDFYNQKYDLILKNELLNSIKEDHRQVLNELSIENLTSNKEKIYTIITNFFCNCFGIHRDINEGRVGKDQITTLKKRKKEMVKKNIKFIQKLHIDALTQLAKKNMEKQQKTYAEKDWEKSIKKYVYFYHSSSKYEKIGGLVFKIFASREQRELLVHLHETYESMAANEISPALSYKVAKGQHKQLVGRSQSEEIRTINIAPIKIENDNPNREISVTSKLVPLNQDFDKDLEIGSTTFGTEFGNTGISSLDRTTNHLVNAWKSSLLDEGGENEYTAAFRTGSLGKTTKRGTKLERNTYSQKAAYELMQAVALNELANQGITLEEACNSGKTFVLNLNSVSLVTPDDFRHFVVQYLGSEKLNDEWQIQQDQREAFWTMKGLTNIDFGNNLKLQVDVRINSFTTGVNNYSKNHRFGLTNQHAHNITAIETLMDQVKLLKQQMHEFVLDTDPGSTMGKIENDIDTLCEDIQSLGRSKGDYLKTGNQYELGAKILLLTSTMNHATKLINKYIPDSSEKIPGYTNHFNCWSGKDRSGVMDAVWKTTATMYQIHGRHITHTEYMESEEFRGEFVTILVQFLLDQGNIGITELNTGIIGYKVGKEAQIFGLPLDDLLNVQGFSRLSSS